jgi:hypothetical protein
MRSVSAKSPVGAEQLRRHTDPLREHETRIAKLETAAA